MAPRNSERLLNLVIALLVTPRFISREQIREIVQGYSRASSDTAFQRMFERDKESLRDMGVNIEVGPTDPYSDEMDGYRIRSDSFYLPPINLTAEESTIVALASSVWSEPTVAAAVGSAITKFQAAGERITSAQVSYLTPRVAAREPGFPIMWEALLARAPVGFSYRGKQRCVHGWKLIMRSGAWYLLGEDVDAGVRFFRLSRIEGMPTQVGEPGSYDLPETSVISEHTAAMEPETPRASVLVGVRESAAGNLRRRGTVVEADAPEGYEAVRVSYVREDEIVVFITDPDPYRQ
jgi:proteasome accessory factor B